MLTGMNKIFEKHQKLLLVVVGTIIVVPFVGFVPGADLFDFFGKSEQQGASVNGESVTPEKLENQLRAYQIGSYMGVEQAYQNNLDGKNRSSLIALHRYALIKKLKKQYKFDSITQKEITQFLKDKFNSVKNGKDFLVRIQQNLGMTAKEMESAVIENFFIEKYNNELKKQIANDDKLIKKAYIKENTKYTLKTLKMSSSNEEFLDAAAKKYYQKNKAKYPLPDSLKVSYIDFNATSIKASNVNNLDFLIKNKFKGNEKKYHKESRQKTLGIIGYEIEDFKNNKEVKNKKRKLNIIAKRLKKEKYDRVVNSSVEFDFHLTYEEDELSNLFKNSIKKLKVGEVSKLVLNKGNQDFPRGIYILKVIEERYGVLTTKVKTKITNEIVKEKNKKRNQYLAKTLQKAVAKEIKNKKNLSEKKKAFERRAKNLKLTIKNSPLIKKKSERPSKIYSKTFIEVASKLSQNSPLSKVFNNNGTYVVAFYNEKGPLYKDFVQVKRLIKETIYKKEAETYYGDNPQVFTIPETKYGYAVNFYPNVKDYKVTDKESTEYYEKNKERFASKQARVSLIRLNYKKGEKEKTRKKLEKIIADIKSKKISFKNAIKKYSDDKTNDKEKTENWITKDRHPASENIFATKKGQVSSIYEEETNLQVFKVEDTSENIPHNRAKKDITNYLQREKAVTDAKRKKEEFYNEVEKKLENKTKDVAKIFKKTALAKGYTTIPISTANNYSYIRALVSGLETTSSDNPLIINDRDFWVGCYEKTDKKHLPKFDLRKTTQKAIKAVNKKESVELVNKKFGKIFAELNKESDKRKFNLLTQKHNFTTEDATEYKHLPETYKNLLNDAKDKQFLATKDSKNEHIIFFVSKKQEPSSQEFKEEKVAFTKQYNEEQEEKVIEKFYQDFTSKNTITL